MDDGSCLVRDGAEFLQLFNAIAAVGATGDGGISRLAASAEDGQARDVLAAWAKAHGAEISVDRIGNLFCLFEFAGQDADWVFAGSHLDSQPGGGRFDGAYGVCAAVAAAAMLKQEPDIAALRNLAVAVWTNEEGARFQPSLIGSSVFAGKLALEAALAARDESGITLREALRTIGYCGEADLRHRPDCYVELHVEQGPILERAGLPIGIVTGIWAARKITLRLRGATAHTGPTPMTERRDALHAAAKAVTRFHELLADHFPRLHRSVGRLIVEPNSPNVVAEAATAWFEIRGRDQDAVAAAGELFLEDVRRIAADLRVEVEILSDALRPAQALDPRGVALALNEATAAGFAHQEMQTVAGHDAIALQSVTPSILLFVPSAGGISHNTREFTKDEDLLRGLALLTRVLRRLISNRELSDHATSGA
jgi:beta-ureidopropionase / N-carbamoyl-L-amino-acid hydrolase